MGKKYVILLLMLMVVAGNGIYAQAIQGAVLGGVNLTQVDGDEVYGFHKGGWTIGASAIIPFNNKWSVSLETTFTQKGSYQKPQYNDSLTYEYELKLDYVEVPVLIHFTDKEFLTAGAGIAWGRLVNVKEYEHGNRVESTSLLTGPYKRDDLSIVADIRFRLYRRWHFNTRYSYSLQKIRSRDFVVGNDIISRDQFNNVITFRLIYIFNEDLPRRKRDSSE